MIYVNIIDDARIIQSVEKDIEPDTRIAWAQENENSLGYIVFNERGELIRAVDKGDIFELLVRSALNHLDLSGVKTAVCKNPDMENALLLIGFKKCGDTLSVDISEFFKPCGHCK